MMRRRNVSFAPVGDGRSRHIGWGYYDRRQFVSAATEFLTLGRARNELMAFVGEGDREQLRAELVAVTRVDHPDVVVTPAHEFYPVSADGVLNTDAAVDTLSAAANRALAEGYSGLRIVGDVTCLVRRPDGREAFARYEFLADRVIAELPIAAMCAFDVTALDTAAAELVCLHGEVGPAQPDFRIHAAAGAAFAISGEIDPGSAALFGTSVDTVWPLLGRGDVVVDASGLDYLDHNALLRLDAAAARGGHRILLRGAGPLVRRLVEVIEPPHTVVEPAA